MIHSIAVYTGYFDCFSGVGDYRMDVFIKCYITIAVIHSIAVYTGYLF